MSISSVPDEFEELIDPIADICDRLNDVLRNWTNVTDDEQAVIRDARDALERLARENANLKAECSKWHHEAGAALERAERAEAERDALREVVRAADAIWKTVSQTPDRTYAMAAYSTARAKVKP